MNLEDAQWFVRTHIVRFPLHDDVAEAAEECEVTVDELRGAGRAKRLSMARLYVYWRLRNKGHSYSVIGRAMHRDHSTIMHGVKRFEELVKGAK